MFPRKGQVLVPLKYDSASKEENYHLFAWDSEKINNRGGIAHWQATSSEKRKKRQAENQLIKEERNHARSRVNNGAAPKCGYSRS